MTIKKFNEFGLNEEIDSDTEKLRKNTMSYNKYKSRVISLVKADDLSKSSEDFQKLIDSLRDDEKGASDMLRALFAAEKMKARIKNLEDNKKAIDQEIKQRMSELRDMQSKL